MIKLYDTRRRQKVDFEPVEPGKVSMYVCGPTVYNRIHIGNARTFISFDMIRRYLSWRGFDVTFVQNVTDVDDKIIRRAAEEARTAAEVAEEYTRLFIEDMHAADVQDPDIRPKATEEIGTMITHGAVEEPNPYVITGIAGRLGFSVISVEKAMMNGEVGFGRKVLQAVEEFGLSFEHMPTGIDTMCVVLSTAELEPVKEQLTRRFFM